MAQSIGNSLATTMIGREIKATGNTLKWDGETPVKFGYSLEAAARQASVRIYNAKGEMVQEIEGAGILKGDNWLTFDPGEGIQPKGEYTFKVVVTDDNAKPMTASAFTMGTITGVRFTASGTVVLIDGVEVPVANILEILKGTTNG